MDIWLGVMLVLAVLNTVNSVVLLVVIAVLTLQLRKCNEVLENVSNLLLVMRR